MPIIEKVRRLQERLGYTFGDQSVLLQSLTHTSYGHEKLPDRPIALKNNERLEFLGDAILDVIISDILLESFPNACEGQLSKMRATIVNEKTLAVVARSIGLENCLRLGRGEVQTAGNEKPSILSSAFEALIAAIYLDGGYNAVYPVVRFLFKNFFQHENDLTMMSTDYKTQLQELMQARYKTTPSYHLTATEGPDHAKNFEVEVRLKGEPLARSKGSSKKDAEQNAAKEAVSALLV